MTGRAEVERQKTKLDATFARALSIDDQELSADLARYLCVLVSGFLEQAAMELLLGHVRNRSGPTVQRFVEQRLRRGANLNVQRLLELVGSFDPDWRRALEAFVVDEYKDAVNGIVDLRHAIAHGREAGVTLVRARAYYDRVKRVVDEIAGLCD